MAFKIGTLDSNTPPIIQPGAIGISGLSDSTAPNGFSTSENLLIDRSAYAGGIKEHYMSMVNGIIYLGCPLDSGGNGYSNGKVYAYNKSGILVKEIDPPPGYRASGSYTKKRFGAPWVLDFDSSIGIWNIEEGLPYDANLFYYNKDSNFGEFRDSSVAYNGVGGGNPDGHNYKTYNNRLYYFANNAFWGQIVISDLKGRKDARSIHNSLSPTGRGYIEFSEGPLATSQDLDSGGSDMTDPSFPTTTHGRVPSSFTDGMLALGKPGYGHHQQGAITIFSQDGIYLNQIVNDDYVASPSAHMGYFTQMTSGRIVTNARASNESPSRPRGIRIYTYVGDLVDSITTRSLRHLIADEGYIFINTMDDSSRVYDINGNLLKDFGVLGVDVRHPIIDDSKVYFQNDSINQVYTLDLPPNLNSYYHRNRAKYPSVREGDNSYDYG